MEVITLPRDPCAKLHFTLKRFQISHSSSCSRPCTDLGVHQKIWWMQRAGRDLWKSWLQPEWCKSWAQWAPSPCTPESGWANNGSPCYWSCWTPPRRCDNLKMGMNSTQYMNTHRGNDSECCIVVSKWSHFTLMLKLPVKRPFFSCGSFQLTFRDVSRISVKLRCPTAPGAESDLDQAINDKINS